MICSTIIAIHLAIARVVLLNYVTKNPQVVFSIITLLPILDVASYLVCVLGTPFHGFFKLSVFVVDEKRTATTSIVNVLSMACTIATSWVVLAIVFFPNQTDTFMGLIYGPVGFFWTTFDPELQSPLRLPVAVLWLTIWAGFVWIPLFAFCIVIALKTLFEIHVSASTHREFVRDRPLTKPSAPKTANSPAPRISGTAVLAVVPLAILVTGLVVSQSWTQTACTSVAAIGIFGLLRFGVHHFTKSNHENADDRLRGRPMVATIKAVLLGTLTGGMVGFAALVAGFHGNAPIPWLYLTGPVAWTLLLAGDDTTYLYILGIVTPIIWIAYWGFVIVGPTRLTGLRRYLCVAFLHIVFAGAYHVLIGLD